MTLPTKAKGFEIASGWNVGEWCHRTFLNHEYPKRLKYTFEVFQKLFLELDRVKLLKRVQSLKSKLMMNCLYPSSGTDWLFPSTSHKAFWSGTYCNWSLCVLVLSYAHCEMQWAKFISKIAASYWHFSTFKQCTLLSWVPVSQKKWTSWLSVVCTQSFSQSFSISNIRCLPYSLFWIWLELGSNGVLRYDKFWVCLHILVFLFLHVPSMYCKTCRPNGVLHLHLL